MYSRTKPRENGMCGGLLLSLHPCMLLLSRVAEHEARGAGNGA